MYILKEDIKDLDELITWLNSEGLINSEYSCKKRNMCAIAIHLGGPHDTNDYIFCSDMMCSTNPHISWLTCRKRYETQEEFIAAIQERLDEIHDIVHKKHQEV